MKTLNALAILGLLTISGLAHSNPNPTKPTLVKHTKEVDIYEARDLYIVKVLDPMADFNRVISDFNADVYQVIEEPATVYKESPYMIPIRLPFQAASNVLKNVGELTVGTTSNIFTGHFADAGSTFSRSIINMFALGGMFDLAGTLSEQTQTDPQVVAKMNVFEKMQNNMRSDVSYLRQPQISNFDDVLREWGVGCGVYLVFPFVGPGTARELGGKVAQMPLMPETYVQPLILVRVAASINDSLSDAARAKQFLQDYDLSTPQGKEQYYNLLRTAILTSNKCVDDAKVKEELEGQGITINDED